MRRAVRDERLRAIVMSSVALVYDEGADLGLDRPAHVRAGSGLAQVPGGIALIQDDANFIALVEPDPLRVRALTLEAGEAGRRQFDKSRGNKKHKLDLEACFSVVEPRGTLLVAMGSGSKGYRARQAVVFARQIQSAHPEIEHVQLPRLYERLAETREFAGSEMNIEGALHLGDRVRLFSRGNGTPRDGVGPVNASCDLDWEKFVAHAADPERVDPPEPTNVTRYELGALGGIPLGFTDATLWRDRVVYSAAAEDSPDVYEDGPVHGSAIGLISNSGETIWAPLTDAEGAPFNGKVEGIVPSDADARLHAVVDSDDAAVPALLCTIDVRGA